MCTYFELLINKSIPLSLIKCIEQKVIWGDELFSQDPKKYSWNNTFIFTRYKACGSALECLFSKRLNLDDYWVYVLEDSTNHLITAKNSENNAEEFHRFINELLAKKEDIYIIQQHEDIMSKTYEHIETIKEFEKIFYPNIGTENALVISTKNK